MAARLSLRRFPTYLHSHVPPTFSTSRQRVSLSSSRQYATSGVRRNLRTPLLYFSLPGPRQFHVSSKAQAGLMPDTENPQPPESESHETPEQPTEITTDEFHKLADAYLEELLSRVEKMQETEEGLDIEYSSGVMTIEVPNKGSYVLNKQPPNKQIWLSSPLSGPKRFDWVVLGESMDHKEGSGSGSWIYLRDGSDLSEVLRIELGINVAADEEAWKATKTQTVTE